MTCLSCSTGGITCAYHQTTQRSLNKMAAIVQTTSSNAFYWQKNLHFDWNFLEVSPKASEWHKKPLVSGWVIKFDGLSWTVDSEIQVVHISRVIIAYTLELISSLTEITHNLQTTINLRKKRNLKRTRKRWVHPSSWRVIGDGNAISVYNSSNT